MARDPLKYGNVDDGLEDELDFAPAAEAPADEPVAADEAPEEPEAPATDFVNTGKMDVYEAYVASDEPEAPEVVVVTPDDFYALESAERAKLLTMGQ